MGLVKGQVTDIITTAPAGADAAGKIFGFSMKDIKDMMEIWRDIMKMRQGAPVEPAPPAASGSAPMRVYTKAEINSPPAAAAPLQQSKADKALIEVATMLQFIVDNGGGEIKLFDALQQSGITVKSISETLQKALK
jgi:hypothetical protein